MLYLGVDLGGTNIKAILYYRNIPVSPYKAGSLVGSL